jgi:hypothetical protein
MRSILKSVAIFVSIVAFAAFSNVCFGALTITWSDASHKSSFQSELSDAAGKSVTIADDGTVTIAGPKETDNSFAGYLRTIIRHANTTTVAVGRNVPNVIIGSYNSEVIDLDDKEQLSGMDGTFTEAGAIMHELVEQFWKQVWGYSYADAHRKGITAENIIARNIAEGGTRPCGGPVEQRTENGKTVYYTPSRKLDKARGYMRLVMAAGSNDQIESVSFVINIPPTPLDDLIVAKTGIIAADMSYLNSYECGGSSRHWWVRDEPVPPGRVMAGQSTTRNEPRLGPLHPNPFNPYIAIEYVVPDECVVNLRIYDVRGRLVQTLVNEKQGIGEHKVNWDGTDARNVSVASGLYLVRFEARGHVVTKKIVLLR